MDTKITKQDIEWLEKELKKVNEEISRLLFTKDNLENTLKMFKEKIKNEKQKIK